MIDNNVMTKQQDNSTETLILKAAEKEFLKKGFTGARTTTIAESAGVTHAMLHYYFRTKEKLFERIISEKIALLQKVLVNSTTDMSAPLSEILRNLITDHLNFVASNPDLPRFLIDEIYNNHDRFNTILSRLQEISPNIISRIQDKINQEAEAGMCRKVDARMLLLDIVSLNVFSYIAAPVVKAVLGNLMNDEFLKLRIDENYDTIMRKLKP